MCNTTFGIIKASKVLTIIESRSCHFLLSTSTTGDYCSILRGHRSMALSGIYIYSSKEANTGIGIHTKARTIIPV